MPHDEHHPLPLGQGVDRPGEGDAEVRRGRIAVPDRFRGDGVTVVCGPTTGGIIIARECGKPIALPDWVESGEGRKSYLWRCRACGYKFEAIAFFDLLYIVHGLPYEDPHLRFSAATETMKKNLLTKLMTLAGGVTFRRSFREAGVDAVFFPSVVALEDPERAATHGCPYSQAAPFMVRAGLRLGLLLGGRTVSGCGLAFLR